MFQLNKNEINNLDYVLNYNDLKNDSIEDFEDNYVYNKEVINISLSKKTTNVSNIKNGNINNNNLLFFGDDKEIKNQCNEDIKKTTRTRKIRIHNDLQFDNIRSNIKIKFFNFIISFFNGLIKHLYGNKFVIFKKINYNEKNKITRQELFWQMKMKMKDILKLDIQSNYKKYQKDYNKIELNKLLNEIQNNDNEKSKIISSFLNMILSDFYHHIFINGKREDLKLNYNLPDDAYLLNEIINNLRDKTDKYKYLYKITALNLINFSGISKEEEKKKIKKILNDNKDIENTDFFDMNNENNFTIQSYELFSNDYEFKYLMEQSKEDY